MDTVEIRARIVDKVVSRDTVKMERVPAQLSAPLNHRRVVFSKYRQRENAGMDIPV